MNQRPLAVPEKIFVLFAYSIFSTAAPSPAALHPPLAAVAGDAFVNPSVVGFIQKKKALITGMIKTFVVAEAGFEPTTFGL